MKTGSVGVKPRFNKKQNPYIGSEGFMDVKGFHFFEAESLTKWTGFVKEYNGFPIAAIPESGPITGLYEASPSNDQKYLIATGRTGIYRFFNGQWTVLLTGQTGGETGFYTFEMLNDMVYMFNGVDAGVQTNGTLASRIGFAGSATASLFAIAGTLLAGTYKVSVSQINNMFGFEQESNGGTEATITLGAAGGIRISVPASTDPQVALHRIYITTTNGATPRFLADVPATSAQTFDYTDAVAQTLGIAVEKFAFGAPPVFKSAKIIGGVLYGASSAATLNSRVYFSFPGKPHAFHPSDFRDLNKDGGDAITGLAELFGRLVAFKLNSIWESFGDDRLTFGLDRRIDGVGSVNHRGIIPVPGVTALAFEAIRGLYLFDGHATIKISSDIDPLYRDFSGGVLKRSFALLFANQSSIVWFVSTVPSFKNNLGLVYDYEQKRLSTREFPESFASSGTLVTDSLLNRESLLGGYDGVVRQSGQGFKDDGINIVASAKTRAFPTEYDSDTTKVFYSMTIITKPIKNFSGDKIDVEFIMEEDDADPALTRTYYRVGNAIKQRFNLKGTRMFVRIKHDTPYELVVRGIEVEYYDTGRSKTVC